MTSNIHTPLVHRYQPGMQIVDPHGGILGDIGSIVEEGGRLLAILDGNRVVDLTGAAEIIDLYGTMRQANPSLRDPHIRLAMAAPGHSEA